MLISKTIISQTMFPSWNLKFQPMSDWKLVYLDSLLVFTSNKLTINSCFHGQFEDFLTKNLFCFCHDFCVIFNQGLITLKLVIIAFLGNQDEVPKWRLKLVFCLANTPFHVRMYNQCLNNLKQSAALSNSKVDFDWHRDQRTDLRPYEPVKVLIDIQLDELLMSAG